jgi:hypothetical protein
VGRWSCLRLSSGNDQADAAAGWRLTAMEC